MIQSPRLAKKRKQKRIRQLFVWPTVFIVFVVLLISASHLKSVSVGGIDVSGNSVIKASDISAVAERDISGNYLHLFPKKNIFIYPRSQIESDILAEFPRIKTVSVSLGDNRDIAIDVTLRKADSLWCATASSTFTDILSESCYFFDQTGYVFSSAPNFEGPVFVKYYGGLSGDPIRQTFLGGDTLSKINSFITGLNPLKLTVDEVHLDDNSSDYDIFLDNGTELYLDGTNSFTDSLNNLVLFLTSSSTEQSDINKFSYIDLRYGNKIYYKLKSSTKK